MPKFLSNVEHDADIIDINGNSGTSGQVLSSLGAGNGVDWIDQTGGTSETAERIEVTVKNVSGGSLSKGTVVHASPSANPPNGNVIEVIAADYDNSTKMPAIGILNETIANEAEGSAVMMGAVSGIDTSGFSIGDELYVGNLGAFTNSKPATAGQLIQKIAVVIKSHASNGLIKIFGAGRSNDVPLPLYIDNANQRVGISEPSPDYKLHVNGQIYSESDNYPVYYLKRNTSATGGSFSTLTGIASAFKLETDSSGTITDGFGGGIVFSIGDTFPNTAARIYARRDGGDQTGALQFWGGVDGETALMTLRASGNVGIGTESPAEKLVVSETRSGTTAADQTKYTLVSRSTVASGQTPGTGGIKVAYDDGTNEHGFGLVSGSSSADFLTSGPMHFYTNSDLNTNSATGFAMQLDTNQRLTIGSITPSQKLNVDGNVIANRYYGYNATTHYIDPNDSTTSAILNGAVSIGASSVYTKLSVTVPTGTGADGIFIRSTFAGSSPMTSDKDPFLSIGCSDATGSVSTIFMGEDATATSQESKIEYSHDNSALSIHVAGQGVHREHVRFGHVSSSAARTRFYGNVGIGTNPSSPLHVSGVARATEGFSTDGNNRFYTWRALQNTASSSNQYYRIARVTGSQSTRFIIELAGRSSSYSDGSLPAFGKIVGQLNNDNNFDIVYYNASATDEVVDEVGQVDVNTVQTDIYVRVGQFAELTAIGHISDGTIVTYDSNSGSTSAPTNYVQATEYKLWNTGNDGADSGLDADLLDGVQGANYFKKGADIGGSQNLNNYTTDGYYHQNSNSNATSGSNYPAAAAGMLSVVSDGVMVYQTYHQYNGNAYYHRNYYNGSWYAWRKVWQDGNHGSGSGLDADLLDGQHASAFAASSHNHAAGDITSGTFSTARIPNLAASKITSGTFSAARIAHNSFDIGDTTAETGRSVHETGIYTFNRNNGNLGTGTASAYYSVLAFGQGAGGSVQIAGEWTGGGNKLYWRSLRDTTDNWWDWKEIYHTNHKPTYSELGAMAYSNLTGAPSSLPANGGNSDTVDNLHAASFLRSDAADTFTGKLSVGDTDIRRAGIYGIYDSNRIGHIWSMGTGYNIANNGADFGNLYGLAYKHTNNTTGGTMGGSHQMVWCNNGSARGSIGNNAVWHAESMKAPIFYDSDNTAYYTNPASTSVMNIVNTDRLNMKDQGDYITFYGNGNDNHSITSRNEAGSASDDIRINSYHSVFFNLDSNNNNGNSDTGIYVGEHGAGSGTIGSQWTFKTTTDGITIASGSFRSPVFYDSNNTSFFAHLDSTADSIRAAGDIIAYYSSDKRYKENIKPIESPIEKVKAISGVTFEWNEKSHKETGKKDVGVIAQEVEEVLPEIVQTRDNGYKAVDYQKLTAVLIEAVKDQQKQIDELKSIINGSS